VRAIPRLPSSPLLRRSGRLLARPCPEALKVAGIFDPADANALAIIQAGVPDASRFKLQASPINGNGAFAVAPLLPATALVQVLYGKGGRGRDGEEGEEPSLSYRNDPTPPPSLPIDRSSL
jgi:hypothetical protein